MYKYNDKKVHIEDKHPSTVRIQISVISSSSSRMYSTVRLEKIICTEQLRPPHPLDSKGKL